VASLASKYGAGHGGIASALHYLKRVGESDGAPLKRRLSVALIPRHRCTVLCSTFRGIAHNLGEVASVKNGDTRYNYIITQSIQEKRTW
jgi:hypothetical protein